MPIADIEFDFVANVYRHKVEHVQLGRLCRKRVIFVIRILPECWTSFRHLVDFFVEFGKIDRVEFDFVASVYRA